MMRKYGYIILAVALLAVLSLPISTTEKLRSAALAPLIPSFRHVAMLKELFLNVTTIWPSGGYHTPPQIAKELEMMRLENHQLKSQLEFLKAELLLGKVVEKQLQNLQEMNESDHYMQRRKDEIFRQLELYSHAITARVIFRENSSWKSSVWVNVGEETNRHLQTRLVAKNSPVVLGTAVVGLVDYVGKHRSRIRFITDPTLAPSVRAIRGEGRPLYLAKGEVQGNRYPLWRSRSTIFKGIGFNYDFEDVEGLSRDLRTGQPSSSDKTPIALVQVGDSVITTGMDGLFPSGLRVGMISKVYPLKEGGTSYETDIQSTIDNFEDISFLTILPPLSESAT